ncbi:hypothetical protein ACFSTG_14860 [Salinimicrobium flavum]|uniref:Uncharacterized protein n=2 Tax=Salinimicrobium flavum TaxID=1737065 RepID=A0ABW5IZQ1_9FLAO
MRHYIFAFFMELKNYIALMFVILFAGKVVTVDARIFMILMDSVGVSLVNDRCEKPLFSDQSDATDIAEAVMIPSLEMDFLCHTLFDLRIMEWPSGIAYMNFRQYTYQDPGIISSHHEKFYPPPKA